MVGKSLLLLTSFGFAGLVSCEGETPTSSLPSSGSLVSSMEEESKMKGKVTIDDVEFIVSLEENEAGKEFAEILREGSLTLSFRDYGGFEKVGELGRTLTRSDERMTTRPGDIVLYQGDQIVLFYGSNTWSYTMLGHVENLENWVETLGSGDVSATFSLAEQGGEG